MAKSQTKKTTAAAAIKEIAKARTTDELENVWNKYSDVDFGSTTDSADFSAAYYRRLGEISNSEFAGTDSSNGSQPTAASGTNRRDVWESRIKEFMASIKYVQLKIEEQKVVLKDMRKKLSALRVDLDEILNDGPDNFVIDATPLLTLAEVAQEIEDER